MTDTATSTATVESDVLNASGVFSVDPDAYLDARMPEWLEAERSGDVRYGREPGHTRNRVLISEQRTDIVAELQRFATEASVRTAPKNPLAIPAS